MDALRGTCAARGRAAFTRLDVLVAVVTVLVLASFFGMSAKCHATSARRMTCDNNLKHIALAVDGYARANLGAIPDLARSHGKPETAGRRVYSWVVDLFPHLDNKALSRTIDEATDDPFSDSSGWEVPKLKLLVCPEDGSRISRRAGMSYVATAGFMREDDWSKNGAHHGRRIDWNRDGTIDDADLKVARATGLFWRREARPAVNGDGGKPVTIEDVADGDGQTQTAMLSENLQAGGWLTTTTAEIGFGIFVTQADSDRPDPGKFPNASGRLLAPATSGFHLMSAARIYDASPGSMTKRLVAARPSSNHPNVVQVAFVDGRVKAVNVRVDKRVWAALLTPNGQSHGEPLVTTW